MKLNIFGSIFNRSEKDNALESLKNDNSEKGKKIENLEEIVSLLKNQNEAQQSLYYSIIKRQEFLYNVQIEIWRQAHQSAIDILRPRFSMLADVYREAMLDTFLTGKINTRVLNFLNTPYKVVDDNGETIEEETKILQEKWFYDLLKEIAMSIFEGRKLIEFDFFKNGLVRDVVSIPMRNTIPCWDAVLLDEISENIVQTDKYQSVVWIGERDDLGLLLKAAPHTIMKRYAKAFWSRFQELFGIPYRWAEYSGNNQKVIDALEMNMQEMGVAAYAVLPAGAKIGFSETSKGDAFSVFLEAIRQSNEEISQIILGTPANQTDTGSFARDKISYEKEGDISFSDLRRASFIVNNSILPVLNKYAYNFTGKLVFDPSFNLPLGNSQKEIDELLLQYYDIDEEYILKTYGVRVTKKQITQPNNAAPVGFDLAAIFPRFYKDTSSEITAKAYNDTWKANDYFAYYQQNFSDAINKGWTLDKDNELYASLQGNAYNFAGSKYLQFSKEIEGLEKDAILQVWAKHERYLAVENQHFTASSQMTEKWIGFEKNKDKLPYLQWQTARDENVRDSHRVLDNIIKPVDDAFWNTHYTPLDIGCRCNIRALSKAAAEKDPNFKKQAPKESGSNTPFISNSGKTGLAFNEKHSYFKNKNEKFLKTEIIKQATKQAQSMLLSKTLKNGAYSLVFEQKTLEKALESSDLLTQMLIASAMQDLFKNATFLGKKNGFAYFKTNLKNKFIKAKDGKELVFDSIVDKTPL